MENNWSVFQEKIFAWLDNEKKTHLMIRAGAGCGKTTTIVELYKRIQAKEPQSSVQFLAFNKKIAEELFKRGVPAGTMNSFGFKQVIKAFPGIRLDADKVSKIAKDYNIEWKKMGMVRKCVSLLKAYLQPRDVAGSKIEEIISEFGLSETVVPPHVVEQIGDIFRDSLKAKNVIDFDDQICYPYYHELPVTQADYMIVDESQDLAPGKLELVSRGAGKHFVCVGDPLQAIYGFCGADSDSMNKIIDKFSPEIMSLPVTYRCGKKIVAEAHARGVAPSDFQAGETNHDGEVRTVKQMVFEREVVVNDFVLCRVNAPCVSQAFNLIKRGIRSQILGRDIGAKLKTLADKINERRPTSPHENEIVAFAAKMRDYEQVEVAKLYAAEKEAAAESLQDQIECLGVFMDNAKTFAEMQGKIQTMFDDEANPHAVVFSSIHKAKGLEADNVWALPYKGRDKIKAKQIQEERNLLYVQITRAKKQFNWVQD